MNEPMTGGSDADIRSIPSDELNNIEKTAAAPPEQADAVREEAHAQEQPEAVQQTALAQEQSVAVQETAQAHISLEKETPVQPAVPNVPPVQPTAPSAQGAQGYTPPQYGQYPPQYPAYPQGGTQPQGYRPPPNYAYAQPAYAPRPPYGAAPAYYPNGASVRGSANAFPVFMYQKTPKEIEKDNINRAANVGGKLTIAIIITMLAVGFIVIISGFFAGIIQDMPTIGDDPYMGFTPMGFYLYEGLSSLAGIFIPSIIILFSVKKSENLKIEELLPFKRVGGKRLAAIVFGGMGLCMVAQIMASLLSAGFSLFGFDIESAVDFTMGTKPVDVLMNSICTAVIPALVEEFAYRGVVLGVLKKYDVNLAIFGSAFLFGMLHGNLAQIPFAFVVGIVLAYVRVQSGSMLPNILIHFGNNFYAVIVSTISEVVPENVAAIVDSAVMIVFLLVGFICIYWLTKNDKDFFRLESKQTELTLGEKVKTFFTSGTVIAGTIILCIETVFMVSFI